MKLNFYITILVLCCCTNLSLWAQQPWCFTDQLHQQRYNSDTAYQQNFEQQQQAIHQRVVDLLHHATNLRDLYTIPVVVHIVSPIGTPIGTGNNLTDAQVATGLDMLNEAFANTNNFQSGGGINTDIQFCLAQRTPDGQATNGILRHYSDIVNQNDCNSPSFHYGDEQQLMDIAFWDCCQYVNIYLVTDIIGAGYGCSVAGYATVGSACGFMVQESQYWNTFNGTQVTAHEMGHFFGLWHTFQNGCDYSANDCLVDGDNVCDTPPDNETFSACNANTCNTDSPDLPDDTNNYMDYGACTPWRFTAGQKTRMIATLETTQNCLLNSLACLSPCPAPLTANLAADAINITVGSTVNFTGAVTNTNVYAYNIDSQAPFANNTPNAAHTFNTIGNYWVKLQAYSNSPLCYDAIDSIQINVNCNITGEIIPSATSINEGNTIIFGTNITGATDYQWTLNGTNVDTNSTYSQQFDDEGNYYICVTASNSFCQKTDCQIIGVAPVGAPVGCQGSTFQITYGGANEDIGTRVVTDTDGGYTVAGYTKSFSPTNFNDGLLFKTSATGSIIWNKKIGEDNIHEILYDVKKTTDGGYIAAGTSYPNGMPACQGSPQQFGFLWRLDAMGNTLWVSKINGNTNNGETAYRAIETADGGFAFVGSTNYACSVADMMIGKVNANGNGLWCKRFANTNGSTDSGVYLIEDNNNIVVMGYTRSYNGDIFDNFHNAFVLKLNANGNEIWSNEYFSQNGFAGTNDNVTSITMVNGNYLVTTTQQALQNWTTVASAASSSLMSLNPANGNIIWQKNFVVQGSQQAAITSGTYNTTNQEIVYTFNDATNLINGAVMDGAIGIGNSTNIGGTLNSTYLGYGSIYHLDQVDNDGYVMTGYHTIAQQRDIYLGKVNNELLTPGCDNDSISIEDINSQMQKTATTWTVSNINNYIQANQQATITSVLLTQSDTLCSTLCEELCDNFIDDNNNGLIDENCPCPTLSLSSLDTTLCQGQGIELTASIGFTTYQWSPTTGLSDPNIRNPIATPTQTTDYTVIATKLGENKIINSDFSYGNFAFTSQQNYSAIYTPCNYYVGTPWFGSLFPECVDHTPTDDNIFMHIDGCPNSPTTLWQQTITDITPNTLYKFSFWATRGDVNPPVFEIHFIDNANNDALMATQTQTQIFTQIWVWDEYGNIYWNSGNNTQLTIQIINLTTDGYGNDFGLDDISLHQVCSDTLSTHIKVMSDSLIYQQGIDCLGEGKVIVTGQEGEPNYEYQLNNGAWQTSGVFDNLPAGNHIVRTRDANGCIIERPINITDNTTSIELAIDWLVQPANCSDLGSVSVSIIDSTDVYYQYKLDNSIAQNNGIFTDLAVGEHTITVNNEHNCSGTITFTIEPFTPPNCDDNLCNTTDTYNQQTCECEHTAIETPLCDDNLCNTTDTYNQQTCECEHTAIETPLCDDNLCNTTDTYNQQTCECEHTPVAPPNCDDNLCNTTDTYNQQTCECEHTAIETPLCDDNLCNTTDTYNQQTCECEHTPVAPPNCDDNLCNTTDTYNQQTCECEHTAVAPPNCDDNLCNTTDTHNQQTCECEHTPVAPPNCDDNLCNTTDTYNQQTCECEHTAIETPLCDDNNPATIDTYDPNTCECLYTSVYKIQIPNAFSPNIDGINDLFGIVGMGITNMHLIIYNRWGEKVFETTNINETWDGNYKGQSQEIGVYAYFLTYSFLNEPDKSYFQKGNITLIK